MKSVAIFDIDGTIFRSSLTIELFKQLVKQEIFPKDSLEQIVHSEQKWLNRQGHYDDYISDVIKAYYSALIGKRKKDIVAVSRRVVKEQKYRTYRFTRNLLNKIRNKYFAIGISGSPLEVVREYNNFLKFDKIYGTEFGIDERGRYTSLVLHEPPRYKKELILRYLENHNFSLAGSIGVGDTESDIGFLELVSLPIAFNPNAVLAREARKRNWTIVIERKDLIVEFKPKKVKFLKV
jgi:HAD superfamily phosphoserine phosphatase-like hydrolase